MDYAAFVASPKSMVVAPAGYGKTHSITECLKYTDGKQLVLTHTHAGVASLKEKIRKQDISPNHYRVETIDSFAQKYVNAYYCGKDSPEQHESKSYYPFIIEKAKQLLEISAIKDVIRATYSGLIVDEYQDCTSGQHNLVQMLAGILPVRIFGDHLQGIFSFNKEKMVNFSTDLNDFKQFPDLRNPWRWCNTNPQLGDCLHQIRGRLETTEAIDLNLYDSSIEVIKIKESDMYQPHTVYNSKIWELVKESDVLFIHPDSTNVSVRKDFVRRFNNAFYIIESIDSKDFYLFSSRFDNASLNNIYDVIYDLIPDLFNGTSSRDVWFNKRGVKKKTLEHDKKIINPIHDDLDKIIKEGSLADVAELLKKIRNLPDLKCYRKELFSDLCRALKLAECKSTTVYDAMKEIRNNKRRMGRKIEGRCIGTTLLTKGLEFDTVAILDAHKFECPKNFYVAITRACKKLIIFTNNNILSPYPK